VLIGYKYHCLSMLITIFSVLIKVFSALIRVFSVLILSLIIILACFKPWNYILSAYRSLRSL
jgi:hypothetical protein